MKEAETLCAKIGILVNGKFMCFGPMSKLKDDFGQGYKLDIVKGDGWANVDFHIERMFMEAHKQDSRMNVDTYSIPTESVRFSKAFTSLEGLKQKKTIKDYSIYSTTLEQVFINFAKI